MAAPAPQGGTNVLRGGKKLFGALTLEGNWYNDRKLTSFQGVRPIVETETQIRAAESEQSWFRAREGESSERVRHGR
jgi:hypothetical protein